MVSVHWCVFKENDLPAFCLFAPQLADSHRMWSASWAGICSPSSSNSPTQPHPGYFTPTCPCGQWRPMWLGARSEAAGAASVGGASRALGMAAGTLAGRVQPERCHVPAPLQRKASKSSHLGSAPEMSPEGAAVSLLHLPLELYEGARHLPAAPCPICHPFCPSFPSARGLGCGWC